MLVSNCYPFLFVGGDCGNAAGNYTWDYTIEVIPEPIPGDLNNDDRVDFADFLIISSNFNAAEGSRRQFGDLNLDGAIRFDDFLILSENYGRTREPASRVASVPEPSSGLLLLGSLLGLGFRSCREAKLC